MSRTIPHLLLLALWLAPVAVAADDLTDSERFLCAVLDVTSCAALGQGCDEVVLEDLNIPRFIEIDLEAETLSTTAASHQNRSSPIASIRRDGDLIILQSYENGRAVSWIIVDETGDFTATVALEDIGVVGFGECTPMDGPSGSNR